MMRLASATTATWALLGACYLVATGSYQWGTWAAAGALALFILASAKPPA